jgi:hypothetical protein
MRTREPSPSELAFPRVHQLVIPNEIDILHSMRVVHVLPALFAIVIFVNRVEPAIAGFVIARSVRVDVIHIWFVVAAESVCVTAAWVVFACHVCLLKVSAVAAYKLVTARVVDVAGFGIRTVSVVIEDHFVLSIYHDVSSSYPSNQGPYFSV